MLFKSFPEFHNHIRSLDSAALLDDFIKRELELNTGTLTVTDHGYLGACYDVYKKAKENKLIPILGVEGYFRDDFDPILRQANIPKDPDGSFKSWMKYGHFTLHCLDQIAYECLIKKISYADFSAEQHGSERKPIFNWSILEELGSQNVTLGAGCLISTIGRNLMKDRPDLAIQYYERMRSIPRNGKFYVEIMPHRCDKNWVSGVFITLEDGTQLKYYLGKKVKTDFQDAISVADLSKLFKKGEKVGKLRAVNNRKVWEEFPDPKQIIKCELIQDFIKNECTDWAPDGDLQLGLNRFLLTLAHKYNDKVVISSDAHYAYPEDKIIQDAKLGGMGDSFRFYGNYHRHSSEEAFKYFHEHMGMSEQEFSKYVDNNREWAEQFKDFKLEYKPSLPKSFYPEDTLKHLIKLIEKHGRMDWSNDKMVQRLKSEIKLLHENGTTDWLPYFFLGEEVPNWCQENGFLPGVGRGSAAGMLVAYLLNITHADPLKYGLSQDRFMTLDRIKTGQSPDIDQDLPKAARDLLVDPRNGYLKTKFGDHFAQISTDGLLRIKSSMKDVARYTYGSVPEDIEKMAGSIPNTPQGIEDLDFIFGYMSDDGKEVKGLIEYHKGLQEYVTKYPDQWKIVQKMAGIKRSNGRHASAYLIADKPLDSFIPMMTVSDVRVTQYTAKSCEAVGGIKMDYLGLNTLADLSTVIKLIQNRSGLDVPKFTTINGKKVPGIRIVPFNKEFYDIWDLPEDLKVFNSICEGDTETVFQLNTHSSKKWLKEFNYWKDENVGSKLIDSISQIAAFTALDRPGPLDAFVEINGIKRNMMQEYAARIRGDSMPEESILNQLLSDTHCIMVFQEQLTAVYRFLTDCDGIEAENFRSDIGKKRMEKVLKAYGPFIERASKKIGEEAAKRVWDTIYTWGQYGFNKSHSVSYAITAYACAFLKYHFPIEWWCAVLCNADKNEIAEKFWKECKEFVRLPDLKDSGENFSIYKDKILAPLNVIQGVGPACHEEIMKYRPYKDIDDFCQKICEEKRRTSWINTAGKSHIGRSALNQGVVSTLILSGVMDSLFPENSDPITKLEIYEQAMAKASNSKPKKINEDYRELNPLKTFLLKKSIMPIYSTPLLPILYNMGIDGVDKKNREISGKKLDMYGYFPKDPNTLGLILKSLEISKLSGSFSFFDGSILKYFNDNDIIDPGDGPFRAAAAGYILDYKVFNFKNGKALKLNVDVDGEIFEFVRWPSRKTNELTIPNIDLKESIVILLLTKWKNGKDFRIDAIIPIETKEKEQNEHAGTSTAIK